MSEPFTVRITVRGYETDTQGHLNQSVYLQYAEHARWLLLQRAGIRQQDLLAAGIGPVALETTLKFRQELRAGDEVVITGGFLWGEGKTMRVEQTMWKTDGTIAAEVEGVGGVMDLERRRLLGDPREALAELADRPELLDS